MAVSISRTAPLAAPTNAAAATGTSTGDLTSGNTYYYRICAITGNFGRPGIPCVEISAVADANGSIDLAWDAVAGAYGYVVYRTPTSGNYSIVAVGFTDDLDRDVNMMCLRNGGLYYTNTWTTQSTSLTDLGSTTERVSGYSYFSTWMNTDFYENGRGLIAVSGGTAGAEATFDDIYTDAVANSYDTTHFIKHYDGGGYRVFECLDYLDINNYFKDSAFTLIHHDDVDAQTDTDTKTFGVYANHSLNDSQFILYSQVGRQIWGGVTFKNTNFYGVKLLRDFGVNNVYNGIGGVSGAFSQTGSISFSDCVLKDVTINQYTQQVILNGNVDFDTVDIWHNQRGLSISADQSASSFFNVRLDNQVFDTTGNYATTLETSTFYNTSNVHRFFAVNDIKRTLLDCVFPSGSGLPASASNGGGAVRNILELQWSFDLTALDESSNAISGATVKITDGKGSETNLTTDANGQITTQQLIQAQYSRATETDGDFDTTASYNPYTITISKSGYKTYISKLTIAEKTELTITLSKVKDLNFSRRIKINTQ